MDFRTLSTVGRFKDIAVTLLKYGFDDLVERLEIPGTRLAKRIKKPEKRFGTYERIRRALEDLGPTFVKMGQMMSLRPDLLPAALVRELRKLQDEVSPLPFSEVRAVVEKNLDRPLEDTFSEFDREPVASASLSQVHRSVLRDVDQIVCVTVQRPNIRKVIEKDLDILDAVAVRLHERSEDLRPYDLPNLARETRRSFLGEIDFHREATHLKIARALRRDDNEAYIPAVYETYSTGEILVMEFVEGTKIKDLDIDGLSDPGAIARKGLTTAAKQVFEDGFFHADPHPGNLLLSEEKGLCLLDWGMVGRLTENDRYELFHLINSVVERDSASLADALISITTSHTDVDRWALERGLLEILDYYGSLPLKDINVGKLLLDMTAILRSHRLRLPPDLVIMIRALVTAEGAARLIYPDLNVVLEVQGYVRQLATRQVKPGILWRRLRSSVSQFITVQRQVPRRLAQIANKIERGELAIRFEHENLGGLIHALENTASRLTLGIIIGAMVIGSSMIITTGAGPSLFGFPALGMVGYLFSGLLGLWLAFNIIRSRKF